MTSSSTQTSDNKCDDKNVQAYVSKLLDAKKMQINEESATSLKDINAIIVASTL